MIRYITKNHAFRVRETKLGLVIEKLCHTGKALRWCATIATPTKSLARAKKAARYLAGL